MKLILFSLAFFLQLNAIWEPSFDNALNRAKTENKLVLLNFSGSDWCGPCIRMRKEILDDSSFLAIANEELIMVNADFPRTKKNKQDAAQIKRNEALAEKYNPDGKFPYTLILDSKGKVISSFDGYPKGGLQSFSSTIKTLYNERSSN